MAEKKTLGQEFSKGLIKENPVLRLVLGTCPTLAVSTSIENAIGMGVAATMVLICSNIVISALRKVIPNKVRIPCYIVVIAAFVTMVQLLVKAFAPSLDEGLGIYLPLITTNCIVLGLTLLNANLKHNFIESLLYGFGAGLGFMFVMILFSTMREKIEEADVPKPFKGAAIAMISAGLMSMAFMGFAGLI